MINHSIRIYSVVRFIIKIFKKKKYKARERLYSRTCLTKSRKKRCAIIAIDPVNLLKGGLEDVVLWVNICKHIHVNNFRPKKQ